MKITQKITIDLARHTAAPVVDVVQCDSVRWVRIELLSNGEAWRIPKDARVVVNYCNAIGEGDSYTTLGNDVIAWSAKKNILSIALAEEVCALPGDTKLQVTLLKDSQQLSTFAIVVRVQKRVEASDKPQRPVRREGYVTPRMFGAVGNGITDDTDAIRMARDAAVAENKALYFPAGTYLVRGHIELWNDCEIYGEGSRTVIKKHKANSEILKPSGAAGTFTVGQQAFVVSDGHKYNAGDDFYFGANARNVEGMRGRIISIDNNIITVESYGTDRNGDHKIEKGLPERLVASVNDETATVIISTTFPVFSAVRYTEDGEWNALGNVYIHDLTIDGNRQQDEASSYTVSAIQFDSLKVFRSAHEQIATIGCENVYLEKLHIYNSPADGISVQSARKVWVTDCVTERCGNGVHLGFGTTGAGITGCRFIADCCGYYDGDGVNSVSVSDNHFEDCGKGIGGVGPCTSGLTVNANTFRSCDIGIQASEIMKAESVIYDHSDQVRHGSPKSSVTICGNTFDGVDMHGTGISFTGGGAAAVTGNTFRYLSAAMESGETEHVYISGNIIKDCATVLKMGIAPETREVDGSMTTESTFLDNIVSAEADGSSASVEIAYADNFRVGGNVLTGIGAAIVIDEQTTAGIIDNDKMIRHDEQNLTEAQKVQARKNIGASTYYSAMREEVGAGHDAIDAAYIWGLYDALMAEHPDKVQKNEVYSDADGTFTNYEYVISTGEYPTGGLYAEHYGADEHIRKPKYLILSGIHGTERCAALSAYRFIRDVLAGHNVPKVFMESAVIHVLPVGTPSAIDLFTRENGDGIDVNRDFDSEAPAKETQAIINWLSDNADAELLIDCHNNGAINEVVAIVGISDNDAVDMAKKLALQGVDKVIPFWRDVIGYPPVEAPYFDENGDTQVGIRDVVFSYCANFDVVGTSISYALNALGIPSITVETSVYYGNYSDWVAAEKKTYPPETIAAGAEAYGNILLEIHGQSFFGEVSNDMKTIDNKLDTLAESVNRSLSFRMESGVLHFDTDQGVGASSYKLQIPCTSGAKVITIRADDETFDIIKNQTSADDGNYWFIGACGNAAHLVGSKSTFRSYACQMNTLNSKWQPTEAGTTFDNEACTFVTFGVKAGNYNWSAYYWNE